MDRHCMSALVWLCLLVAACFIACLHGLVMVLSLFLRMAVR